MFKKKTDEKSSTARVANTTTINVSSPVIYYAGDDKYTDHHIKDKIETVDPAAAKVCNIIVRYFNNLSLLLKPV